MDPEINVKNTKYELSGMVIGTSGHATALCKDKNTKEWFYYNDSTVKKIYHENDALLPKQNVLLAFYRKKYA
jgi:ubiquitin C-terminal hydrolase